MQLAFVDTLAAAKWAVVEGFDKIASDNPLLATDAATEGRVLNADAALSQDLANRLGRAAIDLTKALDAKLRESAAAETLGLPLKHLRLGGASSRLLSALFYRGYAGARAVAEHDPRSIGFGVVDQPFLGPDGISMSRLHNPCVTLADAGFFGDLPVVRKEFAAEGAVRRDSDVPGDPIRRSAHLPLSYLALEAATRLGLTWPSRRGEVFVLSENECLREALPWLAASGCKLRRLGKFAPTASEAHAPPGRLPEVEDLVEQHLMALEVFNPAQSSALRQVITAWCGTTVARLAAEWPVFRAHAAGNLRSGGVVLTNGLFGPRGGLIYGALHEAGATVVDFEHGVTTGLSAHSQAKIDFSEAATSDVVLCCSPVAAAAFAEAQERAASQIESVGLADQTRTLFRPWLQRRIARRALGVAKDDTVVMHVSSLLHYANMRPGHDTPTETMVAETERCLVEDVYARVPHRVIYKPYPAERFAHQPPLASRLHISDNVSISPPEDLRYLRAAADVMVTSTPTSTLGWVVGADIPIVWLVSRGFFTMRDEALEEDAKKAFLPVDIDDEGWPDHLRHLLSQPLSSIQQAWDKKRSHRETFYARAITGPSGSSGRRAARIIRSLMKTGSAT
jgi:hypothetical protein